MVSLEKVQLEKVQLEKVQILSFGLKLFNFRKKNTAFSTFYDGYDAMHAVYIE